MSKFDSFRQFLADEVEDNFVLFNNFHIYTIENKHGWFSEDTLQTKPLQVKVVELRNFIEDVHKRFDELELYNTRKNPLDLSFRTEGVYVHDMIAPSGAGWFAFFGVEGIREVNDVNWKLRIEEAKKEYKRIMGKDWVLQPLYKEEYGVEVLGE